MKILKVALSVNEPQTRDVLWLRPVGDAFALYVLDGGWKALKLVDNNSTSSTSDDTVIESKNKADKVKSATNGNLAALNSNGNLTDSGKKASDFDAAGAASAAKSSLLGTAGDSKDAMTLYGLKAYIDDALENIG